MIQPLSALTSLVIGKPAPTGGGGDADAFASSLAELVGAKLDGGGGEVRQKTADPGSTLPEVTPEAALALLAVVAGDPLAPPPACRVEVASDGLDQDVPGPAPIATETPEAVRTLPFPLSPITPRPSAVPVEPQVSQDPAPIARAARGRPERPDLPLPVAPAVDDAVEAEPVEVAARERDSGDGPQRSPIVTNAPVPEIVIPFASPASPPQELPTPAARPSDKPAAITRLTRDAVRDRPVRFTSVSPPQPASSIIEAPAVLAPSVAPQPIPATATAPAIVLTPRAVAAPDPAPIDVAPGAEMDAVISSATAPAPTTPTPTAASTPTAAGAVVANGPSPVQPPLAAPAASPVPAVAPIPDAPVAPAPIGVAGTASPPVAAANAAASPAPSTATVQPNAVPTIPNTRAADTSPAAEAADRRAEPRGVDAPARSVQPASIAAPAVAAPLIGPAVRMFAAEIHRATRDLRRPAAIDVAAQAFGAELQGVRPAAAATVVEAASAPLDLRHEQWPSAMVERIERLRDAADASDTRIRLVPEALGRIDVSVKRDGEAVHVHFSAEQAATRAMLQEAQPKLAEAAEARGLKLGQTTIGLGVGGDGAERHGRQAPDRPLPSSPAPARSRASEPAEDDTDHRIA